MFELKYEKYQSFLPENFQFLEVKFSLYLNRRVFVMFWKLVCSKRKEFESKFIPFRVNPISEGTKGADSFLLEKDSYSEGTWCAGKEKKVTKVISLVKNGRKSVKCISSLKVLLNPFKPNFMRAPVALWIGELMLDPLGFSPPWFEPCSGNMWESQILLTDDQVVFLRVLRFSLTFDERSARYKWNILERAVKPK